MVTVTKDELVGNTVWVMVTTEELVGKTVLVMVSAVELLGTRVLVIVTTGELVGRTVLVMVTTEELVGARVRVMVTTLELQTIGPVAVIMGTEDDTIEALGFLGFLGIAVAIGPKKVGVMVTIGKHTKWLPATVDVGKGVR